MEHRLHQFYFVYWVQKFVHVDWLGGVDFFDWIIWECAGDWLISECAQYHVGTFVVGSDGTWAAVELSFFSHRGRGGRGGNRPLPASLHASDFILPTSVDRKSVV